MRNGLQPLKSGRVWFILWLSIIGLRCGQAAEWAGPQILTNAVQVRSLTAEQAAEHLPVRLRGVFLGETEPVGRGCVIMDHTEGIYLTGPAEAVSTLERGDVVEAEGVTDPGGFAPFIVAQTLRKIGQGRIPEPRRVTPGELSNGGLDAQWVEVSGVVRSCEPMPASEEPTPPPGTGLTSKSRTPLGAPRFKMELGLGSERLPVQINAELAPKTYIDAEVRLQGICFNQHNTSRQFLSPLLLVPHGVKVVIEKSPICSGGVACDCPGVAN